MDIDINYLKIHTKFDSENFLPEIYAKKIGRKDDRDLCPNIFISVFEILRN